MRCRLLKKLFKFIIPLVTLFTLISCGPKETLGDSYSETFNGKTYTIKENVPYNTKYEVAMYIHHFERLPKNYFTKGYYRNNHLSDKWTPENLYTIGGDKFNNYEKLLPQNKTYTECDIESTIYDRGAKRIVFSNDFKVYYTHNHYGSFEVIYK